MFTAPLFNLLISAIISTYTGIDPVEKTFANPIRNTGADPWIIFDNGWYYYSTSARGGLALMRAHNLDEFKTAEQNLIWTPPAGTSYSKELWAPEIHKIDGKWYIYFAADDGQNRNHRVYVIENTTSDPMNDQWKFRGKVAGPSDKWAIDASVFRHDGKLYMVWSGWEGEVNGQQNIYIAAMSDPLTITGERMILSKPEYPWETIGDLNNPNDVPYVNVNEGPAALEHRKDLFIVYSASGCWTDNYCLGMLKHRGNGNLLDPGSWDKSTEPVFKMKPENHAFGPGHNCFFKSPDGKEDWILYHANPGTGQGCGRNRSPRAQRFTWKGNGMPDFGEPVKTDVPLAVPSE